MSCFIIIHSKQICSPSKQGGSKICQLFKQQSPEREGGEDCSTYFFNALSLF